jgi:hypothetical protein
VIIDHFDYDFIQKVRAAGQLQRVSSGVEPRQGVVAGALGVAIGFSGVSARAGSFVSYGTIFIMKGAFRIKDIGHVCASRG